MPRVRPTVITLVLLFAGMLTACSGQTAPAETSAQVSTPTPTSAPTHTPSVRVVGGGEKPPVVFGGDCAAALDGEVIAAATGISDAVVSQRDVRWTRSVNNLGGLTCEWSADGASGRVTIIPQHALGDAELSAESHRASFEECGWTCAWLWESKGLWISGWESDLGEKGREEADRRGELIGDAIASRVNPDDIEWTRDTALWAPKQDCTALAADIGERLGGTLEGEVAGYHDPPGPATNIADLAAGRTWCLLSVSTEAVAMVILHSGLAWDVPWAQDGELFDLGVAGITAYDVGRGQGYLGGTNVEMSDGTNSILVEVADAAPWDSTQVVTAVAEYVQSGLI
ncbi:hypothetical protein LG299_13510 [Microbacterium lacus]|uniref:hypothetical protein n=1 Tax=Microbacterium lacus TaxID=415217 RepID=UPI00384D88AD